MSVKEALEKFMNGTWSYDQVIEFSESLPPDEAIRFRITLNFLVMVVGPKIARDVERK